MIKHTDTFFEDNLVKYECYQCKRQFILGEQTTLESTELGRKVSCPYCRTEDISWASRTIDENLEELDMGCVGIYIDREE